jgi:hypothetical protein
MLRNTCVRIIIETLKTSGKPARIGGVLTHSFDTGDVNQKHAAFAAGAHRFESTIVVGLKFCQSETPELFSHCWQ